MILAADFVGTTIKLGLVRQGAVFARRRLEAHAERPRPERLEAVAAAWEQLLAEAGATLADRQGTALALPLLTDPKRFRVSGEFGKFPGAAGVGYAAWSEQRLSVRVWAAVLQSAMLAYDPKLVVLGGGGVRSAGVILSALEAHLREHLPVLTWSVPVVAAALGDDAALLGAEALLRQTHPALFS